MPKPKTTKHAYRCRYCEYEIGRDWDETEAIHHLMAVHPKLLQAIASYIFEEVEVTE